MSVQLTPSVVSSFVPARVFSESASPVVGLDFSRSDELLFASSDDDVLRLFDTSSGVLLASVRRQSGGGGAVAAAHAPGCCVAAPGGRKAEHALRYVSLHDNAVLRLFRGHTARVTALSHSPRNDTFLSSSLDGTTRLWDVRSPACCGALRAAPPPPGAPPPSPVAAFDAQGLCFAVSSQPGTIQLFDAKAAGAGPFEALCYASRSGPAAHPPPAATSVAFSLDGKLLCVTAGGCAHVLDAFTGVRLRVFVPPSLPQSNAPRSQHQLQALLAQPPAEACFTPDAACVLMGCADGSVAAWSVGSGDLVGTWRGHAAPPRCLRFSPRRAVAASGCGGGVVALWVLQTQPQQHAAPAFGAAGLHALMEQQRQQQQQQQQAAAQQQQMLQQQQQQQQIASWG